MNEGRSVARAQVKQPISDWLEGLPYQLGFKRANDRVLELPFQVLFVPVAESGSKVVFQRPAFRGCVGD